MSRSPNRRQRVYDQILWNKTFLSLVANAPRLDKRYPLGRSLIGAILPKN